MIIKVTGLLSWFHISLIDQVLINTDLYATQLLALEKVN